MPPRRRQAAPSAGAPGASLASLPDALLERILGLLEQRDRHGAALVSWRWHAAAHSPAALQSPIRCKRSKWLPSLTAWLLRHGQHVRSLDLTAAASVIEEVLVTWELSACLAACASTAPPPSLQQLTLVCSMSTGSTLCVASWCAALRQLTSLDLSTGFVGTLRLSSNLSGLTALKRLLLEGERVVVDAAARLPPNVERLRLGDSRSVALPTQLSALTRLSLLVLRARSCTPDGYAVLTRLGQLAKLVLQYNSYLPACLPQLTGLEGLCLEEASDIMQPEAAHGAIEDALGHLTQLTSLCILEEPDRCPPPAAVAGLSRLQRCCLGSADYAGNPEMPPIALPPGPWAASLRELGASLDVLQHSAGTLAAATQLTRLAITGGSFKGHQQAAFWEWARIHPLLRKLQIEFLHEAELPGAAVHAICSLSRQRPALDVVTLLAEDGGTFEKEFDIAI